MSDGLYDVIFNEFKQAVNEENSDISKHLPYLLTLASGCGGIIEFGVRHGKSSVTFLLASLIRKQEDLATDLKFVDLEINPRMAGIFDLFDEEKSDGWIRVNYSQNNSLTYNMNVRYDMMFIDTDHTYNQLLQELKRHESKINKYIVLHDTDEPYGQELLAAVMQFLSTYGDRWTVHSHTKRQHGLTVLKRRKE